MFGGWILFCRFFLEGSEDLKRNLPKNIWKLIQCATYLRPTHVSNEKKPGFWSGICWGRNATHLYKDPYKPTSISWKVGDPGFFGVVAHVIFQFGPCLNTEGQVRVPGINMNRWHLPTVTRFWQPPKYGDYLDPTNFMWKIPTKWNMVIIMVI